jgi:hypothetical protein
MMNRIPRVHPGLAVAALLASTGVAAWSLQRALVVNQLSVIPAAVPFQNAFAREPRSTLAIARLAGAVGKDPFHPERRRPTLRFRFPGEGAPASATTDAPSSGSLKLIGTAIMPEGKGFAMCQVGAEPPKLVRIGERVGQLTLKGIEPGRAVFLTAAGKRYEVQVPKAGS